MRTLWSGLLSGLKLGIQPRRRAGPQPTPKSGSVDGAATQASGVYPPGVCVPLWDGKAKRFYSLIIEVRPTEADAETLQLFSDEVGTSLAAILKLPAGCQLRRCTSVSPDFAQILINM
ncbi:MAG TPA: hypothetical protein VFQ41_21570 [Candidatus Angelobacter sp.]|nr:hypothetical protein [Candidatus Angelobacter sp.]